MDIDKKRRKQALLANMSRSNRYTDNFYKARKHMFPRMEDVITPEQMLEQTEFILSQLPTNEIHAAVLSTIVYNYYAGERIGRVNEIAWRNRFLADYGMLLLDRARQFMEMFRDLEERYLFDSDETLRRDTDFESGQDVDDTTQNNVTDVTDYTNKEITKFDQTTDTNTTDSNTNRFFDNPQIANINVNSYLTNQTNDNGQATTNQVLSSVQDRDRTDKTTLVGDRHTQQDTTTDFESFEGVVQNIKRDTGNIQSRVATLMSAFDRNLMQEIIDGLSDNFMGMVIDVDYD